jgi:glycosyltransferase involved in cell wall biosynthesis
MNICFLCNEYPPAPHGGVGSFTQTLGRALAAAGHRVTSIGLYPLAEEQREDDFGVEVIRLPYNRVPGVRALIDGQRLARELARLDRRQPLDVLDGPEMSFAITPINTRAARIIRMNGGHHFFMTTLGQKPLRLRSLLERRSFARASRLCAVSRFVAETTRQLLRLGDQAIEILPNPVDTERFRPHPEVAEERGLIVFVGTLCEKKGIRQLIEAMPEIVAAVPHARLLAAGRDWRDPVTGESYLARLQSSIPERLQPHIEFTGHFDNAALPQLLARASVCVYPSHMEAQGIVIIEGMAAGKAVVSTRTGPGPELMEDGVSGLLCDPHDARSIARQVIRALQDAELRRNLGQAARRRAVEMFSVAALVTKNEDFYRNVRSGFPTI